MSDFAFADAHVHTSYSANDCQQPLEGYLALLRERRAKAFGITDHMHPPSEALAQRYAAMPAYRFPGEAYIADIRAAKAEGLCVYAGVEVTYEAAHDAFCAARALEHDFDYRIASVHSINGFWVTRDYYKSVRPGAMFTDLVKRYYGAVLCALALPWADVIGHIGVYRRFLADDHPLMLYARDAIERCEDEAAKACALSGKIIEVNTSGLFAPGECTMPSFAFLEKYRRYGGGKICLASDAHDVSRANGGFAQAAKALAAIGFTALTYPWAGGEAAL